MSSSPGGVKKGGTGRETICAVVDFARSNVGNIKKRQCSKGQCSKIVSNFKKLNTRHPQHTHQTTTRLQKAV